jgi:hypothetical protein
MDNFCRFFIGISNINKNWNKKNVDGKNARLAKIYQQTQDYR